MSPLRGEEFSGRSVEEAIERGLRALGKKRTDVEYEVLEKGKPANVLGIGGEDARVLITFVEEEAPPEPEPVIDEAEVPRRPDALREREERREEREEVEREESAPALAEDLDAGAGVLRDLLALMGVDAEVAVDDSPRPEGIEVLGPDLGALIGRGGENLVALQQITFWTFFLEALTFLAEVVLIYTVYVNWDRLRRFRKARLGLLFLLNIDMWWQMFFIDVVASFMLTPNGGDANFLNQILNPTQIPLDIHRTVGNVAFTGAIVAFVGAVKYLRATRRMEHEERAAPVGIPAPSVGARPATALGAEPHEASEARYWDWVAQWGAVFAIGFTSSDQRQPGSNVPRPTLTVPRLTI